MEHDRAAINSWRHWCTVSGIGGVGKIITPDANCAATTC